MKCLAAAAGAIIAATSAAAAASSPLLSQTYTFGGRCDGADMVYKWSLNDGPPGIGIAPAPGVDGNSFIYPWRPDPIVIRGVEIAITAPAGWESYLFGAPHYGLLMVGNNYAGDIMLMMGSDQTRAANLFPAGDGFAFPARKDKTSRSYIDLHATCSPYRHTKVLMTLYFTPQSPAGAGTATPTN